VRLIFVAHSTRQTGKPPKHTIGLADTNTLLLTAVTYLIKLLLNLDVMNF
jgi:hypothetical protein